LILCSHPCKQLPYQNRVPPKDGPKDGSAEVQLLLPQK